MSKIWFHGQVVLSQVYKGKSHSINIKKNKVKENAGSQSTANTGLSVLFFTFIKTACNSAFEEYYFVVVSAPKYRVRPVRVITGHLAALDV